MSGVSDPYNLQRFVEAQAPVYEQVRRELTEGRKRTHWMWFVFPQLSGLGRTAMAERFGIASLAEARAYLAHPVLGPRLREFAGLLREYAGSEPIEAIMGSVDALKLRSSMTLFARAGDPEVCESVLARYYGGVADPLTEGLLRTR